LIFGFQDYSFNNYLIFFYQKIIRFFNFDFNIFIYKNYIFLFFPNNKYL
jgi:hypothetical protein